MKSPPKRLKGLNTAICLNCNIKFDFATYSCESVICEDERDKFYFQEMTNFVFLTKVDIYPAFDASYLVRRYVSKHILGNSI